jgi:hypothetical protein
MLRGGGGGFITSKSSAQVGHARRRLHQSAGGGFIQIKEQEKD